MTGQTLPNVFVGSFVPGTGDRYNGMVTSSDPNYPKGFRDNQGIEPEPRLGLAWDITGDGKTGAARQRRAVPQPARQRERHGRDGAQSAGAEHAEHLLRDMDTLLAAGAAGAFSNRPSNVFGIQRDAQTPKSFNYSVGIQREIGWGTVLDVTYAGFQMRNGEMSTNINSVPDGARFLDINPQNANPQNPTTAEAERVPAAVPRVPGHHDPVALRRRALQLAAGAAQSPLHQRPAVRGRLHAGQDRQRRHRPAIRRLQDRPAWGRVERRRRTSSTQLHNLVVNYTWDVPNGSRMWNNALTRGLLDGWQLSGDTAVVSGDWSGATHVDHGQLRLHRRRRRHAAEDQRRRAVHERQLRSDAGRHRQLLQRRRVQPADRPRRHRQRAGARSSGCRGSCMSNMSIVQELPDRRRPADAVPLGDVQRLQPGELVGDQHQRPVQSGGRAGQRQLRPGDGRARARAIMQGAIRFTF